MKENPLRLGKYPRKYWTVVDSLRSLPNFPSKREDSPYIPVRRNMKLTYYRHSLDPILIFETIN